MEAPIEKVCFKCGSLLPIDEFYKHPQMGDGHLGKCKTCNKKDVQENYRKRKAQYAEYERRRFQDPDRKEKIRGYQATMRAKDPRKWRGRNEGKAGD